MSAWFITAPVSYPTEVVGGREWEFGKVDTLELSFFL